MKITPFGDNVGLDCYLNTLSLSQRDSREQQSDDHTKHKILALVFMMTRRKKPNHLSKMLLLKPVPLSIAL